MRLVLCLILFLIASIGLYAQSNEIKLLNQKMTEIRRNTNWDDPASARAANEEIKRISKQVQLLKQNVNTQNPSKADEINKQNVEANIKTFDKIMDAVEQGKDADILLGEPIRDEIIEEFKNDESPVIKNQDYLDESTLLVIDMSLKTVQRTIDQMENFKAIKTLIIHCSGSPSPVNLSDILKKAKNYPLEELYINNFQNYLTTLPAQITGFKNLTLLSVINNKIRSLPAGVYNLRFLKTLYVDINPISGIATGINKLRKLETLGVGKTNISDTEITKIKQLLPNCNILTQ